MGSERVRIERKPLEVLRQLLVHAGELVSKDELLNAIWGEVTVVEASLPTAVRKLRVALGDGSEGRHFIETVAGIGYRFATPIELEESNGTSRLQAKAEPSATATARMGSAVITADRLKRVTPVAVIVILAVIVIAFTIIPHRPPVSNPQARYTTREVIRVMRRLDADKAEAMIEAGWKPDTPLDAEGDTALGFALGICEWDPKHDPRKLQLMVVTLLDGGARLDRRNAFGDTPYSIARAPRYCGPDHPVTMMIRRLCTQGLNPLGDRCMATYELARGQHLRPAAKPNG